VAHGDFFSDADGLETNVGFSGWPLRTRLVFPVAGCAWAPGFSIVLVPPVTLVFGAFVGAAGVCLAVSWMACGAFAIVLGSSGRGASFSAAAPEDFVPSIHCTVSGAQSSSSSSISAHFASFPASSACSRVARWIPYCCFSSSSVNCFGGGGGTGWFLFHTLLASGPEPAPLTFPSARGALPEPDLATRRGFAVRTVAEVAGAASAALSPGRAAGVVTADFRKFFVTETDLNVDGFFIELLRTWFASRFDWSTLPGRLMSVSEPPLASAMACSPESPLRYGFPVSGSGALAGFCSSACCVCQSRPARACLSTIRTSAAAPGVFSATCTLSGAAVSAEVASVASVAVELGSEMVESVVAGPEGSSPWAAGVLVVDAVSSMGAGRPTDCASFTTSLVTCSAITVSGTAVAKESTSDSCSVSTERGVTGVTGVERCASSPAELSSLMRALQARKSRGYSPSVRCYKSPRGWSGRFRRNVVCVCRGLARRVRRCRLRGGRAEVSRQARVGVGRAGGTERRGASSGRVSGVMAAL
jgi:hypothetical protein